MVALVSISIYSVVRGQNLLDLLIHNEMTNISEDFQCSIILITGVQMIYLDNEYIKASYLLRNKAVVC